jgi:lysophospholipase L1-like esterase
MNVESVTRDGHYSFAVFHRPHIRRTSLFLIAAVLSLMIIVTAFTLRPESVETMEEPVASTPVVSTFTSIDCDAVGADDKYFQHLVGNMANHQPRRCVTGATDRRHCKCESPKVATRNPWDPEWNNVFQRNLKLIQDSDNKHLDVLMLGDSLVEHWLGTNNSHFRSKVTGHKAWGDIHDLYQQYFQATNVTSDHERVVSGLALGIAQDGFSQLLYRLQNGELPVTFKVPILWINIGINDVQYYDCTADGVVAGLLSVIQQLQEIRKSHDQPTRIVINSLVPLNEQVTQVNERLHCYAQQIPNVDFFDVTPLLSIMDGNVSRPNPDLFADTVNLNAQGYKVWGEAIVHRVLHILEEEGL